MAKQYIRDVKAGDQVEAPFFLQKKALVPFRDPSRGNYLTLTLSDKTGQIDGRVWDAEKARTLFDQLEEHRVVAVVARAEEYRGQKQLAVHKASLVDEQGPALLAEFVPTTGADLRKLKAKLEKVLLSVTDEHLAKLVRWFFARREFYDAYTSAPAARQVHHSYLGGLLEHSLEVVDFCELAARLNPALDRDLLIVGALLHDVGKIKEYSALGAIEMTDEGRLLGHTVIGLRLLDQAVAALPDLPADVVDHLSHLIVSHHGELANGAPVVPLTREAGALHLADLFSARLRQFEQVIAAGGDAPWSGYDRLLGRALYSGFAAKRRKAGAPAGAGGPAKPSKSGPAQSAPRLPLLPPDPDPEAGPGGPGP